MSSNTNTNLSLKTKRHFEMFGFISSALVIAVLIVSYTIYKRLHSLNTLTVAPCSSVSTQYMVNITDDVILKDNGTVYTSDMEYPIGSYWTDNHRTLWGCPCMLRPCINKCCDAGEIHVYEEYQYYDTLVRNLVCKFNDFSFSPNSSAVYSSKDLPQLRKVPSEDDSFFVINKGCNRSQQEEVMLEENEQSNAFLLDNGNLVIKNSQNDLRTYTEFCVESSSTKNTPHFTICLNKEHTEDSKIKWTFKLRGAAMLISVVFMLVTITAYLFLPELRNLHGKIVMCYVISLTVAYVCLGIIQLTPTLVHKATLCITLAFVLQYSLLASFFWLNTMCFNMWWVFSGLKPLLRSQRKTSKRLNFTFYSLYAWVCPLAISVVSLAMDFLPGIPDAAIRPEVGVTSCFFKEKEGKLLYLFLPIGVLVYLNVVMFIATSLRFKSHLKSTKKLQRGESRRHCSAGNVLTTEVQRFNLYLKLSVVMGVNWVLELVSFYLDNVTTILIITDVANALLGVAIFYLFVCKRRTLRQLNQRLCPSLQLIAPNRVTKATSSSEISSSRLNIQSRMSCVSDS